MKKTTTKKIGDLFENKVFNILCKTDNFNIEHYNGGGDRGRDIVVKYEVNGDIKKVHIECKSRKNKIGINDISDSVDWAKAHDQDLYYLWTDNYLQPNAKDYLNMISKNYDLNIAYEEKKNIDIFLEAIDREENQVFINLTNKILKYLKIDYIHDNIGTIYDKLVFKIKERISEYCSKSQIEYISYKENGLIIKIRNKLMNISCELDYRFNSNGTINIFINDSIRYSDMKFPSLILEVENKTLKLNALCSFGNMNNKLTECFTNIENLIVKISDQIMENINRVSHDQIFE
jgi:hypothetical protein